ncbi:Multi antimicrobial extrusion protein (Na(+)/drug antiporter) [Levilactobacillus brevis]|nr:Multi antimicrobial extrusion protein (Na(+)/drug antiporter) [Levilactobacillus brevis]
MEDLFERAPIPRAYFKLALPVVLSMVASMIYNLADTFFVRKPRIRI